MLHYQAYEVIGINSAIYTPSGTTAGIGFAMPIKHRQAHRARSDHRGSGSSGLLGSSAIALWPELSEALKLPVQQGLLIERTVPRGPAAQAGIRGGDRVVLAGLQRLIIGGDIVVAIDGREVESTLDLNVILNQKRPGDVTRLSIYRVNQKKDLSVTLGEER